MQRLRLAKGQGLGDTLIQSQNQPQRESIKLSDPRRGYTIEAGRAIFFSRSEEPQWVDRRFSLATVFWFGVVACSPRADPSIMRVPGVYRDTDSREKKKRYHRTNRQKTPNRQWGAWTRKRTRRSLSPARGERGDLSSMEKAICRCSDGNGEAPQRTRKEKRPAQKIGSRARLRKPLFYPLNYRSDARVTSYDQFFLVNSTDDKRKMTRGKGGEEKWGYAFSLAGPPDLQMESNLSRWIKAAHTGF